MDENTRQPFPSKDAEGSPTQKLLRKDIATLDDDAAATSPITSRLTNVVDSPEEKKSNTWIFVLIGGAAVIIVVVLLFIFVFTGDTGLHSGSTDINATGTDSYDASIVEGRPAPDPVKEEPRNTRVERPPQPRPETPTTPSSIAQELPDPAKTQASRQTRPVEETPPPPAEEKPAEPEPEPQKSTPTPQPAAQKPVPAATPPASIAEGFDLKKQEPAVKEGDLVPLTGDVIRPVLLKDVNPTKPAIAQRLRRSGKVILRILIDEKGNVSDARIVNENPGRLGFGDAAIQAAKERQYKPATKDGVRVKVWETLVFTFR